MFWDGQRWIPDAPAPGRRSPSPIKPRRLRDWLATIPLVLLVPALLAPMLPAQAGRAVPSSSETAAIRVRGSVSPGGSVKLMGTGFTAVARAAITWDASQTLGSVRTNQKGSFMATATIPSQAAAGKHVIAVVYEPVAASSPPAATVEVALGDTTSPDPTAAPTPNPGPTTAPTPPAPTAPPTANPTAAPTARPTTAPDPTTAPTPQPTPDPTPDPTPRPTPTA